MLLVEELRAGKGGASDSMGEGLGLGLRRWGGCEGGLSLGGGRSGGEQLDLLADGPTEVVEGLLDVGRVVVGLGGVLVADRVAVLVGYLEGPRVLGRSAWYSRDGQHLLVHLFQGIDTLLQLDVVRRKLGL